MSPDFKELLAEFNAHQVEYLVVGAHALAAHGHVEDLTQPGLIFQIGVPPVRVDVITAIDGIDFRSAWTDRVETELGGVRASVLSREHLIANKRASGRYQDLADVERLEAMEEAEGKPSDR